jgi:hypothetical protein
LTLSVDEIQALVKKYEAESKALRSEIYKLAWYMRGSVNIDQAFMLDNDDRSIIIDLIKENLETTKESGMPFF